MVSKQHIFVWSKEGDAGRQSAPLPLPPSGLPHSARSVVVYKKGRVRPPGLLVVSGEGVARHWPSIESSVHDEAVIDLASEVTLSVQLLDLSARKVSFILTTTSGSVFLLRSSIASTRGEIEWTKIGSREAQGIGRRLSNIIFGSQASTADGSKVINSLVFEGDSPDVSHLNDPAVVTISPSCMNCFDVNRKQMTWSASVRNLFEHYVTESLMRRSREALIAGVDVWLLDAAKFRSGMLLLLAGSHDNSNEISFFLAMTHFDVSASCEVDWFSIILDGGEHPHEFKADEESTFIGRVFLCVPDQTANASTCERTDGVIILYPNFVQSVYPSSRLTRDNELQLNKVLQFPADEKVVGHACDGRFCYVMTVEGGISCVRLLPKGFEEDSADDTAFVDDLRDTVSQDEDALFALLSAFSAFTAKKIVEASEVVKPLLSKSDAELTALVYSSLKRIIDCQVSSPEVELERKKVACSRAILFLRHMHLYERVAPTKILISNQRNSRTGASILDEMVERVSVAIKLRHWETVREDRAEILEQIAKRLAHKTSSHYGYDGLLYSKLSIIHQLPAACADTLRELMKRAVDLSAKRLLVHLCADVMLNYANAIEETRRSSKTNATAADVLWTTGAISDAYLTVCKILLKEMENDDLSHSDTISLREYVVRLAVFHLSECNEPIDGHEIIFALYNIGECDQAVELAERFRDFKVLVKVCLDLDHEERRARLDAYKARFAEYDFDMYLCRYLREKNLYELLLDEKGERVDHYLASCEGIRWRREIQNLQFEKASHSLLSVADREKTDVVRQQGLYAFAKLAAACADATPKEVMDEANKKLVLIKHQLLIPESLVKSVYPDNPKTPLSAFEIIELNMVDPDVAEGHKRALDLVARLLQDGDSAELRDQVKKIWVSVVNLSDWKQVTTIYEVASTPFGDLLRAIAEDADPTESLLLVLPPCDALLRQCKKALSVNDSLPKWIRDAVERAQAVLKASLDKKEAAKERRKNAIYSVPHTSDIFRSRPAVEEDGGGDCVMSH